MNEAKREVTQPETVHRRAAKGGLIGGVSFAVNLGLNVVQVPLLLRFWPQETYGLWLSVGALATLLTTLDGGHQLYIGNLLNRQYVEDREQFRVTLASAVRMTALTSGTQIVLALVLCFSGLASRWLDIPLPDAANYALAVVIYAAGWIATGSIGSVLVRLFPPTGHFVRSTWWAIAMRIVQFVAVAVAAWLGWGIVGTALLFVAATTVSAVFLFLDLARLFPEYTPWWQRGSLRIGLRNFARSGVVSVVAILDLISLQGVILLVTGSLGAAVVPLFTTLRTMANIAMQGTGFLLNPIQPDLVRYHVQREPGKITSVFAFFWFATGLAINGGMIAGLFVVEPVYRYWTHGRLEFDRALFGWLVAAVLVRTAAAPAQNFLSSINQLRALFIMTLVRTLVMLGGALLLAPRFGLAGVGAAIFVGEFIGPGLLSGWFTRGTIRTLGSAFAPGIVWASISSTLLACVAVAAFATQTAGWRWWLGGSFALVGVVAIWQWQALPTEVRQRLCSLVPRFRIARIQSGGSGPE